jgi:hypothetical protein
MKVSQVFTLIQLYVTNVYGGLRSLLSFYPSPGTSPSIQLDSIFYLVSRVGSANLYYEQYVKRKKKGVSHGWNNSRLLNNFFGTTGI